MAKRYESEVRLASPAAPPRASVSAAFGDGGLSAAAERLGATLTRNAQIQEERAAAVEAAKLTSEARLAWNQSFLDAQQNAPEDGNGFYDGVMKNLDADIEQRLQAAPERARTRLEQQFAALRTSYGEKAQEIAAGLNLAKQSRDLQATINLNANAVRTNFDDYPSALGLVEGAIGASSLSQAAKEKQLPLAREAIIRSALQGLNERDPEEAQKRLAAGHFDAFLTPEVKNALVNDNANELRRLEAKREQDRRIAEMERKAAIADLKEEARYAMSALGDGIEYQGLPALIDRAKKLDPATATALDQARRDVGWIRGLGKLPVDAIADEVAKARAAGGAATDPQLAAAYGNRAQKGEKVLGQAIQELRGEARTALTALANGTAFAGLPDLIEKAKKVDPDTAAALDQARQDLDWASALQKLSPAGIAGEVDAARKGGAEAQDPGQALAFAKRAELGEKLLGRAIEGLRKDPLGWAEAHGAVAATPLDPANPDSIRQRRQAIASVAQRYELQSVPFLKAAEAEQLVDSFNRAQTPGAKLDLLAAFTLQLGDDALAGGVIEQLRKAKLPENAIYALEIARDPLRGGMDPERRGVAKAVLSDLTAPAKYNIADKDLPALRAQTIKAYADDGIGAAYQAAYRLTGNAAYEASMQRDVGALEHIAKVRASGGVEDPASSSYSDLFGHMRAINDGRLAHIAVPADTDMARVQRGLVQLRQELTDAAFGPIAASLSGPLFSAGEVPGLLEKGNIDLAKRPRVKNADGSISTVKSFSVNLDGREVLLPQVTDDGRIVGEDEAIEIYRSSGKHLGIFTTPEAATAYGELLHNQQESFYNGRGREERELQRRQIETIRKDTAARGVWVNDGDGYALIVPGARSALMVNGQPRRVTLQEILAAAGRAPQNADDAGAVMP